MSTSHEVLSVQFERKILENWSHKKKQVERFDNCSPTVALPMVGCRTVEQEQQPADADELTENPTSKPMLVILLFGCVMTLFGIVLILVYTIQYERTHLANPSYAHTSNTKYAHTSNTTYFPNNHGLSRSSVPLHMNTNRLFTADQDVDFVIISLEKRIPTHFQVLQDDFRKEGISVTLFKAINGKDLNIDDYPMTPQYRNFFINNQSELRKGNTKTNYLGHLGCSLSHIEVLRNVKNMTVICEDDIDIHTHFREKFQAALAAVNALDKNWEILLLGFTANYNDYYFHKGNDRFPIYEGGITKIYSWIGGWSYVIRNTVVAEKLVKLLANPLSWHIDLRIAEENRNGNINAYACMPVLCSHAGSLRISSWDFTQTGKWATLKSDTNS